LNPWFGLTIVISAFSEIIYWTSPTFLGSTREFDRLLIDKFVLSAVSFVMLNVAVWFLRIFSEENKGPAQ